MLPTPFEAGTGHAGSVVNIEIVTIGDELLLGFTVDSNAAYIARCLAVIGVAVSRRATVGDSVDDITDAAGDALERTGGVVTTGGLGPTNDDRTKPAIAALFGRDLRLHEPTLERMKAGWIARGLPGEFPAANVSQAMMPDGAVILENAHGTAPGIWLEDDRGRWVAMLPGVPREMRRMLEDQLIPLLRARGGAKAAAIVSRTLRTSGVPESRIADLVGRIELPQGVDLAYLPGWEGVDLRLTARGIGEESVSAVLTEAAGRLIPHLGDSVYGEGDEDMAVHILQALRGAGWTAAVAESCTGGMLGMRLTAIPGSSDVVRGGIIAYDNEVKVGQLMVSEQSLAEHGAVSEEVAGEMAAGARKALGASVGVAITGIAGPGGATDDKPVGTVCIAVETPLRAASRTVRLHGDRDEIRRRATQAALVLLRKHLRVQVAEPGAERSRA